MAHGELEAIMEASRNQTRMRRVIFKQLPHIVDESSEEPPSADRAAAPDGKDDVVCTDQLRRPRQRQEHNLLV